jgi:hypothetical protein
MPGGVGHESCVCGFTPREQTIGTTLVPDGVPKVTVSGEFAAPKLVPVTASRWPPVELSCCTENAVELTALVMVGRP